MNGRWLRVPNWFMLGLLVTALALVAAACGGEATTVPPTTAAPAPVPTPTPVDVAAISSELRQSITDAVSGIEIPEGMSEADVERIVESAVAAAAADSAGQMSDSEIQGLVAEAIAQAIADSPEPLSEQQIAQIVRGAIPTPVPTPTAISAQAIREEALVNPGKVTIMNGLWGTGPRVPRDAVGEDHNYHRAIHSTWITGNANVQLIPGAAESWEISPDGLTWTITLREGIKFHNGEEATGDDLLFSAEFTWGEDAVANALSPSITGLAAATEKIEQVGPMSVAVTHDEPKSFFPFRNMSDMSGSFTGVLMPKAYYEGGGTDPASRRQAFSDAPIGAGPFSVLDIRPSEQILVERFDEYYYHPENGLDENRRARFQTLDLRLVPEPAIRVAALRAGEADIAEVNLAVGKQVEDAGGRIVYTREGVYIFNLAIGCWKPEHPCHHKAVRHAFDYAIDKEAIMNGLYGGPPTAIVKGYARVGVSSLGYEPGLDPFPFDPEKARELLAEAGYPNGEGFPAFKLWTYPAGEAPFMPELAQLMSDMWKEHLNLESTVEVSDGARTRELWWGREIDGDWHVRPNEIEWDGGGGASVLYGQPENQVRLSEDPELKAVIDEALSVVDPAKRHEAYNKMWTRIREEHYMATLGILNLPWGVGPRIAGWEPWPMTPYNSAFHTITLK
jgi:peptide/nickel transport system substrate-binding protein